MSFLTKKEKSIISLVQLSGNIPDNVKQKTIADIKHNASLRSENYRPTFKRLFGVITSFKSDKIINSINL